MRKKDFQERPTRNANPKRSVAVAPHPDVQHAAAAPEEVAAAAAARSAQNIGACYGDQSGAALTHFDEQHPAPPTKNGH